MKIKQREKLYNGIRNGCDLSNDKGIYLELDLTLPQKNILKILFENYILKTLESYYMVEFEREHFLVDHRDRILELPNKTPNGILYPKVENVDEYNKIQSFVNDILIDTKLVDYLDSFDLVNIRIVDGKTTNMDSRLSATSRLHSDAWAGHEDDAVLTIGILGDQTTSLEFNKITDEVSEDFFETQPNYDDGLNTLQAFEHIGNLKFDTITIFDHSCLHRTIKAEGGLRVSLDIGIKLKTSSGLEKKKNHGRKIKTIDINDTLKIGKEIFIEATETLEECYNRFTNDEYDGVPVSSIYDTIKISEVI